MVDRAKQLIEEKTELIEFGSVRGMLNLIDLNKSLFYINPVYSTAKVKCRFSDEIREKAIEAVGKYIEVSGRLKRKRQKHTA